MNEAETIARGGQPVWRKTFTHPQHGELTFTVERLPTVQDWLAHAVIQEQIAPGVTGAAAQLAAAVAAMRTFLKPPVLEENRTEDPDTPGRVIVEQVFYDPLGDEDNVFPLQVWIDFYTWRMKTLSDDTREQVKNSSGATSGAADGGSSPEPTASPPTTHA